MINDKYKAYFWSRSRWSVITWLGSHMKRHALVSCLHVCSGFQRLEWSSINYLAQSFFSQYLRAMGANHSASRPYRLDPTSAPPRVPNVQFRVLIVGRANAGKTSILQRVCDTTESPEVYRSGGPWGTRDRVRVHSQWHFQSHHLSRFYLTPQ